MNKTCVVGTNGPKHGFGSSTRVGLKEYGPGPGSYKIPVQVGNVAQYNMPNRNKNY